MASLIADFVEYYHRNGKEQTKESWNIYCHFIEIFPPLFLSSKEMSLRKYVHFRKNDVKFKIFQEASNIFIVGLSRFITSLFPHFAVNQREQ